MSFMGPFTNFQARTNEDQSPKLNSLPLNSADYNSYLHDKIYYNAKNAYESNPTPENQKIQMNKIHKADDVFINEMNRDTQEPMAKIAGDLIRGKKILESTVLPTKTLSGFGSDPILAL